MRNSAKCPKCAGSKIFVCENHQASHEYSNVVVPLNVFSTLTPPAEVGIQSRNQNRTDVGSFETWICAGCGYTEWYAQDPLQLLEKLSRVRDSGVRLATPPTRL